MQSPIREQIRLDGQWQARRVDDQSVSVFVPGSWTEKEVMLKPGEGRTWGAVDVNGTPAAHDQDEDGWRAGPQVKPGQWNTVTADGDMDGASMVAANSLRITSLEAGSNGRRSLSVRVRLTGPVPGPAEAAAPRSLSMMSIEFTLTTVDGRQVGGLDVVVGNKTRDLSVEMPLTAVHAGLYRLKATLCCGDQVVDNARIDLHI